MNDFEKYVYDALYHLSEKILDHYNPCQRKDGGCVAGRPNPCCFNTRFKRDNVWDPECKYSQDGLCLYQNLECRIWMCETAIKSTQKECVDILRAIEKIARVFNFIEPPYLGDQYFGADKPIF